MCEARVSSPQHTNDTDVVILGPRSMWTESDVTSHVSLLRGSLFVLHVQYKCWEFGPVHSVARHRTRKRHFPPQNHLRAPALLLFLEEEGHPMEWTKYVKATSHTGSRSRRSKELGSIGSDIPNYKRSKNSAGKNQCKLHSYRVAFRDLGWDHWIIAPPMYNPRYCMGDCPRILHYGYNSPNHAIVQTVISELGVADIPLPSCVPYKYKPISVLMMEKNGSIVYKEYEDMIAESCTCRWLGLKYTWIITNMDFYAVLPPLFLTCYCHLLPTASRVFVKVCYWSVKVIAWCIDVLKATNCDTLSFLFLFVCFIHVFVVMMEDKGKNYCFFLFGLFDITLSKKERKKGPWWTFVVSL